MNQINNIILEGLLLSDPRLVAMTQQGDKFVKIELANHRRYKDSAGALQEEVLFISAQCWAALADKALSCLEKGMACRIVGRLRLNRWKTKEGETRRGYEIVANHIEFRPKGSEKMERISMREEDRKVVNEPLVYYEF